MKTANIKSEPSGKRRRRHRRWRKKKIGKSNLPCRRSENRWRKNSKLPRMLESKLNMSGDEFEGTCFSDTSTSLSSILIPNRTASHVQDSSPLELFLDIIISRVAAPSRDEYFFFLPQSSDRSQLTVNACQWEDAKKKSTPKDWNHFFSSSLQSTRPNLCWLLVLCVYTKPNFYLPWQRKRQKKKSDDTTCSIGDLPSAYGREVWLDRKKNEGGRSLTRSTSNREFATDPLESQICRSEENSKETWLPKRFYKIRINKTAE